MATLRKIWILQANWAIRRHNNVKLRHCVDQLMPRGWKWWANYSDCVTLVAVLCDRFLTTSPRTAGRRKQKPARSEWIRRTVSSLISPTLIVVYALCLQSAFCCVLPFSEAMFLPCFLRPIYSFYLIKCVIKKDVVLPHTTRNGQINKTNPFSAW